MNTQTSKTLVFRKVARGPMVASTSTINFKKKPVNFSAAGLFGVLSPDFVSIDPFVQQASINVICNLHYKITMLY